MRYPCFSYARILLHLVLVAAFYCPLSVARAEITVAGADISAAATLESQGAVFRSRGKAQDVVGLLRENGANCFRLRLFVAPDGKNLVTNDLAYTLALAKRVKASGAKLLLDIHYSDTWADPAKQFKPAAWEKLDFDPLVATVGEYTAGVLRRFKAEGVPPDFVQLGNEITNGMLWPDGRVEYQHLDAPVAWSRFSRLLLAARAAVDAAFVEGPRPLVVLHIESTAEPERSVWFFRHIADAGVAYDVAGFSYYPEWHGDLDQLRATLNAVAREFHKPVMVVETAYPWRHDEHWNGRPHLNWPLTAAGQQTFLRDVVRVLREVPEGLGTGIFYWHPESISAANKPAWLGGSCALFESNGEALPAATFAEEALHPAAP